MASWTNQLLFIQTYWIQFVATIKSVFDVSKRCIVGGRVVYLYTASLRRCYDCVYGNPEAVDLSNFLV